jgi:hypothetical protein
MYTTNVKLVMCDHASNQGATGIVTKENFGSHARKTFNRFTTKTAIWDRDSSVGIATRYGLDDPGIESRWRRDFPHPFRPALGAHSVSYTIRTGSFPGVKRPGRGVDHPPPKLAPKLKEE